MDDTGEIGAQDDESVLAQSMELFAQKDFVLEPLAVPTLLAYQKAGGSKGKAIELLSANYEGLPQFSNLLGCWVSDLESDETDHARRSITSSALSLAGAKEKIESCQVVRDCFELTVSTMVAKIFNADSADKIFEVEGSDGIDWLPDLISHRSWRRLIYKLAEQFPNCLMLNFAVKLISDAGFQAEISNVNTAAQQLDIFSRVFISSMDQLLAEQGVHGENTETYEKLFDELQKVACHSEHIFTYTQALLHVVADQKESGKLSAAITHIAQSLREVFVKRAEDIAPLSIAMAQSETEISLAVTQAMLTMLTKHSLNPADISRIHQSYFEPCPPPVDLIRDPFFMNMLIDALFNSATPKVSTEYRPKYVYLLAYATCVAETTRNGIRVQSKVELDHTRERLERLLAVLNSGDDLLLSLNELLQLIRTPILAVGVLHHLKTRIMKEDFLGEPPPIFFVLVDQISSHHPNLHPRVFKALCELYVHQSACGEVAEIVMHRQRSIIDRFVHLLFSGYALAVVEKIVRMFREGRIDLSLVRYFGVEVLEIISAPYSAEFMQAMLPIVGNPTVFDNNTLEKNPNVREFIEAGMRTLG